MLSLNLKQYIIEAEQDAGTVSRVIKAIEQNMPRLLGSKIYRFGGKNGTEAAKSGTNYLYFFGDRQAFRVRTKGGSVVGFDVWKTYKMNGTADYTIDTADVPVAVVAKRLKKIAAVMKDPSTGRIDLQESYLVSFDTSEENLVEAKGVSPEEFLALAKKTLGDRVNDVTFDQIVAVAKSNNVAVPNKQYLDKQKIGRGRWTLIPGAGGEGSTGVKFSASGSDEDETIKVDDGQGGPALYIKVTAQDPVSKQFISTAESAEAKDLLRRIRSQLSAKPSQEEMRDIDTLYGHLYQLVTMACNNKLRSLLIYGGPGTGKTYTIMEAIKAAGLVKGKDYVKLSGKATPIEIYKTLFMFREGGLVLFDDLDSMWKDKDAANYLKAALDTSPVREISSLSSGMQNVSKWSDEEREDYNSRFDRFLETGADEEEEDDQDDGDDDEDGEKKKKSKPKKMKFPSTFNFKGRVVFISNLRKEEFDSAIMSRSAKIDMSLTPEETLRRMRSVLPTLGGTDVSIELKEELIRVLVDLNKKDILEAVTMRDFIKGLDIVRSGVPNWQELVKYS